MQLLKVNPKEFGIEEGKATQMVSGLAPIISEREILAEQYATVVTKELIPATLKEARELRIRIRDNRTKGVEKWHKANKEFYLAGGRFVDAIKNKEVAENIRMEENLEQIEKHFESLEKQRIADLQKEREALLLPFDVENASAINLGHMDSEIFEGFLLGAKIKYEQKIEAQRLAAEAEAKRIADEAAERERVRIENERLKAEAEAKEKELAIERAKVEAERLAAQKEFQAQQDALRKENEAKLAKAKAEHEARENAARIEREKEQAERARLEAELFAKKQAEAKAEAERLAEIERQIKEAEKLAKAPIKKQLTIWVSSFELPKTEIQSPAATDIKEKFEQFKNWAKSKIESI